MKALALAALLLLGLTSAAAGVSNPTVGDFRRWGVNARVAYVIGYYAATDYAEVRQGRYAHGPRHQAPEPEPVTEGSRRPAPAPALPAAATGPATGSEADQGHQTPPVGPTRPSQTRKRAPMEAPRTSRRTTRRSKPAVSSAR